MYLYYCFLITILGALLGSFLACMGYRIPNKIKTTYPSSFCHNCKKPLKWYMNIPIISYIFLGGKCAYCKKKIGLLYFLCELLCSSLFLLSFLIFGFSMDFFVSIILICALIVTIVSDFNYYYISDRVLIISSILLIIVYLFFLNEVEIFRRVVSAIILFLVMVGIKILGNSMFHRESLGDGDIKLMGVIALGVGLINSFISLFFASLIALTFSIISIKKYNDGVIPFGPFLLIGALLVIYLSDYIMPFINNLI